MILSFLRVNNIYVYITVKRNGSSGAERERGECKWEKIKQMLMPLNVASYIR